MAEKIGPLPDGGFASRARVRPSAALAPIPAIDRRSMLAASALRFTDVDRTLVQTHTYLQAFLAMETKTARLTILIDPAKKEAFEMLCAAQDLTSSQVVRQLIREYLERHGVTYKTKSPLGKRVKRNAG